MVKDFASLIGCWPRADDRTSIGTFATDAGVRYLNAQMMRHRNSISSKYWPRIVAAGRKRGLSWLTFELLAQFEAKSRKIRGREPPKRARPSKRDESRQAA